MSKKLFDDPKFSVLKQMMLVTFKDWARKLHITLLHKDSLDFFFDVVKEIIKYRETNSINRNDFMDMMIQLKDNGALDGKVQKDGTLTIQEIAAQSLIFILAGFETSSTAMTYCLFELSENQNIQDKARENVRKVLAKHNGQFTYEAMMEMDYIEYCINGKPIIEWFSF